MSEDHLPTAGQMLDRAAEELRLAANHAEECLAWLRSDWRPVGSPLTAAYAARRRRMRETAATIKRAAEETMREDR